MEEDSGLRAITDDGRKAKGGPWWSGWLARHWPALASRPGPQQRRSGVNVHTCVSARGCTRRVCVYLCESQMSVLTQFVAHKRTEAALMMKTACLHFAGGRRGAGQPSQHLPRRMRP